MTVNNKGRIFLSDLKLYSDFLRYREDLGRYETWDEAVEEVINTHRVKYQGIEELIPHLNFAEQKYKEKYVLAAQRNLQFRGWKIYLNMNLECLIASQYFQIRQVSLAMLSIFCYVVLVWGLT